MRVGPKQVFFMLLWGLARPCGAYGIASYDRKNFLCSSFDEFCDTVLDGLGCNARSSEGCPGYPTVSNDVSNYIGNCTCNDNGFSLAVGSDVTKQIMKNRVGADIYWLLEPWASGPPYTYSGSYSSVCGMLLDRLGCPSVAQSVDVSSFRCECGTLQTESSQFVREAITARLNKYNIDNQYPVFARPVYLSLPLSIAMILVCGKLFAIIAVYLSLPAITGFICAGAMLQNYLDPAFLLVGSTEIKKTALLIVLMRAGLSIKVKEVHRTRVESSVLGTVPYLFEFFAFMFLGPLNLVGDVFSGWSLTEMGLLAAVMAPLGPSVVITQALQALAQKGRKIGFVPKVSLISAPLEAVLAIFMFDVFRNLMEEAEDNSKYPWVKVQPLWATLVLIPVNILFSIVLGVVVGFIVSRYIDWRKTLRTDFLWVRLNRNLQMGSNTADLVFVLLVSCYTVMALCVPRYVQQSTGILAVFTVCITLKFFVKDISIVSDIAEGLRAIWIFAEVFLCTLLGATFAFIHENGPLTGQRGLSPEDIMAVAVLMLVCTLCRLLGVIFSICVVMYPTLPPHRQQWPFLWRYCLSTYIMQLPRSTIQASLGPLVFSEHMMPGFDGQNKAFVVSQSGAFTVFVFAPLGALLSKHYALHLTKALTHMDEESNYNHSKFRYYSTDTLQKRVRTPSQMELITHTATSGPSPGPSPGKPSRRRSVSDPSRLMLRRSRSADDSSVSGNSTVQELSLDAALWLKDHALASKVLKRTLSHSNRDKDRDSEKRSRASSSSTASTPRNRHRTVSKSISFSTEGKPGDAPSQGLVPGDNGAGMSSELSEGGGLGGDISPHISKDASGSPSFGDAGKGISLVREGISLVNTPAAPEQSSPVGKKQGREAGSLLDVKAGGETPPAVAGTGTDIPHRESLDSADSRGASEVRFAEVSSSAPLVDHTGDDGSESDSGYDSAYDFESGRGINREAYRVAGDSDTMSESSDGSYDDEGPIDGEEGEQVDYNELFRQSRLHEMTTLFDTMMSLRRAGRGLQLDTPGPGDNSNVNTPTLRRNQSSPAGTSTSAKETPTSVHTEAMGQRGGRRNVQTLHQRLFGTGVRTRTATSITVSRADQVSTAADHVDERTARQRATTSERLFGSGGFFRSSFGTSRGGGGDEGGGDSSRPSAHT
jgi:NhaP-type Na+/H+ or K+/H+ antiporter